MSKIYVRIVEYYSALKRNKILTHATTEMDLENIILYEKATHKMSNIVWFHIYEVPRIVKFVETESRMVVTMAEGGRE